MEKEFKLSKNYIELFKLLKITHIASTGGHGKILVENGEVMLNGKTESRKRAKVRSGDIVECNEIVITVN